MTRGSKEHGRHELDDYDREQIEAAMRVVRDLLPIALDADGKVAPDAESLFALRRWATRDEALRALVDMVAPRNINPALWLRWLRGGEEPYSPSRVRRPGSTTQASGRVFDRSGDRIETQTARVERAREKVAQAERELAQEENALTTARAMDDAVVHWAVSEHLAQILGPVFAMGPAWTLMRVCSAHVSDAEMAAELEEAEPEDHEGRRKLLLDYRAETSRQILGGLDLWSGDAEFEGDMRNAIEAVVRRYAPRNHERSARNERIRGAEDMAISARPSAALDRQSVLDGLRDHEAGQKDGNERPEQDRK